MLPAHAKTQAKALAKFVSAIRQSPSQETEKELISVELANIRKSFLNAADLTAEDRCRLLLHLLYISTLGYPINGTGSHEALNLLASSSVAIRCLAFLLLSLLYSDDSDIVGFVGLRYEMSLKSKDGLEIASALSAMATMMPTNNIHTLLPHVERLANPANETAPQIRRRAYIALLKMCQRDPSVLPPAIWAPRLAKSLEDESHQGCLLSLCNLIYRMLCKQVTIKGLEILFVFALSKLGNLRQDRSHRSNPKMIYYGVVCPWLQVQLLKILQVYPCPRQPKLIGQLESLLMECLTSYNVSQQALKNDVTLNTPSTGKRGSKAASQALMNQMNAEQTVVYEALEAVSHFRDCLSSELLRTAVATLANFVAQRENYSRYLGLQVMGKIAMIEEIQSTLAKIVDPVLSHLSDSDPTMRKQAIELLFVLCNASNWELIVERFIASLRVEVDENVLEDIPLKVVVLCERFCGNLNQFVELCLELLSCAPTSQVWRRVVQVVTGFVPPGKQTLTDAESERQEALQTNTVIMIYQRLKRRWPHEKSLLQLYVYLLGEFGYLLVTNDPPVCSYHTLMSIFVSAFQKSSDNEVQVMSLISMAKLLNSCNTEDPSLANKILDFFHRHHHDENLEIQQRAWELYFLCQQTTEILETVLALMPAYPAAASTASHLMTKLAKTKDIRPQLQISNAAPPPKSSSSAGEFDRESDASSSSSQPEPVRRRSMTSSSGSVTSDSSSENDEEYSSQESTNASDQPQIKDPVEMWKLACISASAPLRITPPVTIYVARNVKEAAARLTVTVSNNTSQPIRLVSATPMVSTQNMAIRENPFPVGGVIQAGRQIAHVIDFQHLRPSSSPLTWSFVVGETAGPRTIPVQIPLPLAPFHFNVPVKLSEAILKDQWMKLTASTSQPVGYIHKSYASEASLERFLTNTFHLTTQKVATSIFATGTCKTVPSPESSWSIILRVEIPSFKTRKAKLQCRSHVQWFADLLIKMVASYILKPSANS